LDWSSTGEIFVGVIAGGLINAFFSWQGPKGLKHEAKALRDRTIALEDTMNQGTADGKITTCS
jgi:hypothetical protein